MRSKTKQWGRMGGWLIGVGMLAAGILGGTGCGADESVSQPVELTFSWWGNETIHRLTLEAVEEYERIHPEVTIKTEYQGEEGYFQKIATQMADNTLPDIFQYQYEWLEQSVAGSMAKPADLRTLGIDFHGVEEVIDQNRTEEGEVILYPLAWSGTVCIINEDFFERHGLEIPERWTWEEMIQMGEKVHQENATDYLLQASIDEMNAFILPTHMVQQSGQILLDETGKINFTSGQMTETLELIQRIYDEDIVMRSNEETMVTGEVDRIGKWEKGQIGFRFGSIADYMELLRDSPFPLTSAPLPRIEEDGISGYRYHAQMGLAVSDQTKYPEEAAAFLQWFVSSEEAAEILGISRGMPANTQIREYLSATPVWDERFVTAEKQAQEGAFAANGESGKEEFLSVRKTAIIQMLEGQMSPKDAAWSIMKKTGVMSD